jgi:hypothetical protein
MTHELPSCGHGGVSNPPKIEDIDYSDIPKLGEEFFRNAVLWPGLNQPITLYLDPEVMLFCASMSSSRNSQHPAAFDKNVVAKTFSL